jgi:hypothetical protein
MHSLPWPSIARAIPMMSGFPGMVARTRLPIVRLRSR